MRFNRTFEVFISQSDFVVNTHYSGPNQCKFETDRYFVALYETPEQYIQRRIQLSYGITFEVIISKRNFAVSTHYHGMSSCKIRNGEYYIAAYETPVHKLLLITLFQYDPFNIPQEDLLASADAEEPLGSTRYTHLRGDRADVRVDPGAGAGGSGRTSDRDPDVSESEESAQELDPSVATVIDGFHVGGNRTLGKMTGRESLDMPPGTHCNKTDRTGNMCCSGALFQTMTDAFYELSSSPQFSFASAGNVASLIKLRAQRRFGQSFEVIVSSGDFATASYSYGDNICKYSERGFTAMAYATPVQYDITQTAAENYMASISSLDNLGATEPFLPGQRSFHTPLALTAGGERAGFPMGSHCGEERAGSRCCNLPLFNVMRSSYNSIVNSPGFDPYDTRRLARTIQWNAEEMLQMSLEVFVAGDDFGFSSSYSGDAVCKYRVDRYYIMAYATPVQYPIHSEIYDDSGPAVPVSCPKDLKALEGSVCCDGTLQYEMNRVVDETLRNHPEQDQTSIARAVQRSVQRRFGTTFESIASKGDFVWQTNIFNENTCKIDAHGYHLLTVESSKLPPPIEDFIDGAPPSGVLKFIGQYTLKTIRRRVKARKKSSDEKIEQLMSEGEIRIKVTAVQIPGATEGESVPLPPQAPQPPQPPQAPQPPQPSVQTQLQPPSPFQQQSIIQQLQQASQIEQQSVQMPFQQPLQPRVQIQNAEPFVDLGFPQLPQLPQFLAPPQAPPPQFAPPPFAAPPGVPPPLAAPPAPFAVPPPAFVAPPPAFVAAAPPPVAFGSPVAFAAGGGGGGGGCFSTDTWVTTPEGKKRMDELKAYFAPMSLWIHREPDVVMKFVTIMTDYGKMLALTPRHLIFRNKCDGFAAYIIGVNPFTTFVIGIFTGRSSSVIGLCCSVLLSLRTWESPGGQFHNEIDHIIFNRKYCLTDVSVVPNFYTGSDNRLLRARFRFSRQGEMAAKFRKRSSRTTINWDIYISLVGLWEDAVMDNVDEEYDRFVHHLHVVLKEPRA
ncbi:unnamed protein product [Heligmosomoides polygyrus]|uniref:HintN domain-containing protein n=1 Tax=Heligmosomoides polygyrus TaxID=6339 RepID=A0A183FSY2_HELPZ|nr:unnamed protein product [Heligmosomoides polygyrus]